MEMVQVDSSNIDAIGYDEEAQELHVQFQGGSEYVYSGVPGDVHERLMSAPSKGRFLNTEVKGIFSAAQV